MLINIFAWIASVVTDVVNRKPVVQPATPAEPAPAVEVGPAPPPAKLVDLRKDARTVYKGKPYTAKRRPWSKTTGICLHQTACVLGERAERMYNVGAHFVVTRSGVVYWLHDLNREVIHGNGWNARTVGIEVDGLYAGVEGDPRTVWDDPHTARHEVGMELTEEAAESTRQLVAWIHGEIARNGGECVALVAHRQASENRRNDPGSAIWQRVALPMKERLGLRDGGEDDPHFRLSTGYPIPEAWDPTRRGIKY